jgi:hypothetical protein
MLRVELFIVMLTVVMLSGVTLSVVAIKKARGGRGRGGRGEGREGRGREGGDMSTLIGTEMLKNLNFKFSAKVTPKKKKENCHVSSFIYTCDLSVRFCIAFLHLTCLKFGTKTHRWNAK